MPCQVVDNIDNHSSPTTLVVSGSYILFEQYNHLIDLLERQKMIDNDQYTPTTGHALLAGKVCLMSSFTRE